MGSLYSMKSSYTDRIEIVSVKMGFSKIMI